MNSLRLAVVVAVLVCLAHVQAQYTEEDFKHMKMMFCGECKDESVKKDLQGFANCATAQHAEVAAKVMHLREQHKANADQCFEEVMNLLKEYVGQNPDAQKQAEGCFHSNVKKEDLAKCH